jgi:hypothetical protein
MSSLVNVNESHQSIEARLRGKGFLQAGEGTPYTHDKQIMAHTLHTATRLHAYPDVHYGAYTDKERAQ